MSNETGKPERGGAEGAVDAPEEARLIERCQRGDLDAFDRLLGCHQDAVFRTALRLMGDSEEAFDLAQDVLLTAFRKIGQFRGEARFSTWLYRITLNLARNRWKSASRKPVPLSLESGGGAMDGDEAPSSLQVADGDPGPRSRAADREMILALEGAVARLAEPYREVVVLRHVEGLTYEEIASILEANLGTVKSRLSRAREMLRSDLGPKLDDYLKG